MVKNIIFIIVWVITLKFCMIVSNFIVLKNVKGCFGINRFNNNIQMVSGKKFSTFQFMRSAIKYISELEVGKEYVMVTHTILKDYIIENKSKYNLKVVCDNKIVKSRILIEKIWLLNFKDFFEKVDFYEVRVTRLK